MAQSRGNRANNTAPTAPSKIASARRLQLRSQSKRPKSDRCRKLTGQMLQAIQVLLNCDLFQITLRTIVFLYDHINLLSFDARGKVVSMILEDCFYKLYLHWLSEVRLFFCNLLVYKLFRWNRCTGTAVDCQLTLVPGAGSMCSARCRRWTT